MELFFGGKMNNTDNTSSKSPFKFPTSGQTRETQSMDFDSESIPTPTPTPPSQRRVSLHHRYQSDDLTSILFLSKRGMSRSPLAREIMRDVISNSSYFGRIRTFARGVTPAYDQCPLDGRMKRHCEAIGIYINGFSRFSTLPDLAGAEVIINLDHESNLFTQKNAQVILGQVRPFGSFLPGGCSPYVSDPYERPDDENVDQRYDAIVSSVRIGCQNLLNELPALLQV